MNDIDRLLMDLVAINSINPDLVPGAPGEAEIAVFIAQWLKQHGVEVRLIDSKKGRPNVVGVVHGTGGGKTLMLNGHMDTVGVDGMPHPFEPSIKMGRLYGRGAYDMKGGVAACMSALAALKGHPLRGDVVLTAVADEEYAGLGTMAVAEKWQADGAIVAEFTELQLILAHKGFVWLDVETTGRAAHGSRPDLGVDAIAKMGKVLVGLEGIDQELRAHPTHARLGSGSVHASLIHGGQELSSYPERCVVSVERRTIPGETPQKAEGELQELVQRLRKDDPSFEAVVRRGLDRVPMETPESTSIVTSIQKAAGQVLSRPLPIAGVPFWTDAATLWAKGIPSVLLGAIGGGAHAVEEWTDLASVRTCAEIYLATALDFCQ
jgi:acetylornithine deacetylase